MTKASPPGDLKNSKREHRALAGQPGSAFGSAPIDDSSALFGRHTLQKTVVSGPLDSAGLKCSLHCKNSLYVLNCLILFCHFTAEFIPAGVAKKNATKARYPKSNE